MKNLGIAFGVALATGLVLFALAALMLPSHISVAEVIGGLPFLGTHNISEALERRNARQNLIGDVENSLPSYKAFAISWKLLAIYGALVVLGISQLTYFVPATMLLLFGLNPGDLPPGVVIAAGLPIALICGFSLGRWIGSRSESHGVRAVLIAAWGGALVTRIIEFAMLSPENFSAVYSEGKSVGLFAIQVAIGGAVYAACGLAGYWRGRRTRFTQYLRYLLSVLPKDTRDALVTMAHEEAQRLGTRATPAPAAAKPAH